MAGRLPKQPAFGHVGPKYDLVYRRAEWVQLVHRYLMQWTLAGGDKVKTIRKGGPAGPPSAPFGPV